MVRASNASQRPSGERTRLATTRWVWSCGSTARLVCCRNAAATIPSASTTATSPPIRNRVWAWASIQPATAATAASWASSTWARTCSSPRAHRTDTDFGAEQVTSKPRTEVSS